MTPAYFQPEQATRQPLGYKTDVWSWGVSVLQMFVGMVTWLVGAAAPQALASHVAQDKGIPMMPADLVKLLTRCFQIQPDARPTTMMEIATTLQEIYTRKVGSPYQRKVPQFAEALAGWPGANQALSLIDLGKAEEAKQVWEQALKLDPHHLETTYNLGIVLWRRRRTD